MEQHTISGCLLAFSFASFLLGSIKLQQIQKSFGKKLLIIGLTILTIVFILDFARSLGIIKSNYHPYMESSFYTQFGNQFQPWERLYFWGTFFISLIGFLTTTWGFFVEGRRMMSALKNNANTN